MRYVPISILFLLLFGLSWGASPGFTLLQFSKNGVLTNVDSTNGLPISGNITSSSAAVGATGSAVPASADFIGAKNGTGNLVGLLTGQQTMANSLACVLPSDQSAIPVTGTFFQGVQPVSESGTWTIQPGNTANTTPWLTTDTSDGPVSPGTAATKSGLIGGQFNTALPTLTNTQQSAIQLDSSGRVLVGSIAGTTTVAGTVAATESGTWTVQPGNTPNTTPWLTTDSSDGPVTAGTAATKSGLIGGQFNTSLPTLTTGQQAAIQLDSSGRVLVGSIAGALPAGSAVIGKVGIDQTTPGTTNLVSIGSNGTVTLLAGAAKIGQFAIDQTTPGTTNLVSLGTSSVQTKAPLNSTGSGSAAAATVSTVITLTAPASAVGAFLMNIDTSTANVRWAVNRTATATLGQQLQPGRDVWIPTTTNISLVAESGTQTYDVQWISQ